MDSGTQHLILTLKQNREFYVKQTTRLKAEGPRFRKGVDTNEDTITFGEEFVSASDRALCALEIEP